MNRAVGPFWISAFLDLPAASFEDAVRFWEGVTGYRASPRRGDDGEFLTLVPPAGDDHLRMQRLRDGQARVHLDLHVADPRAAAETAVELGAAVVHASEHGYVVLHSPAGLTFCFVSHPCAVKATPAAWPGGRSIVDQVCLDLPPSCFDAEREFWLALLGWPAAPTSHPSMARIHTPPEQPLRLLLQRTDDEGPAAVHLDLSADDPAAEVARQVALGAEVEFEGSGWTVLRGPGGLRHCITPRRVETGLLA